MKYRDVPLEGLMAALRFLTLHQDVYKGIRLGLKVGEEHWVVIFGTNGRIGTEKLDKLDKDNLAAIIGFPEPSGLAVFKRLLLEGADALDAALHCQKATYQACGDREFTPRQVVALFDQGGRIKTGDEDVLRNALLNAGCGEVDDFALED